MSEIRQVDQDGWHGEFLFDESAVYYSRLGGNVSYVEIPLGKNPCAAFVFTKGERCLVLRVGRSHLYPAILRLLLRHRTGEAYRQ
jgi:hypothetical protein